jgi:hypothetical protein
MAALRRLTPHAMAAICTGKIRMRNSGRRSNRVLELTAGERDPCADLRHGCNIQRRTEADSKSRNRLYAASPVAYLRLPEVPVNIIAQEYRIPVTYLHNQRYVQAQRMERLGRYLPKYRFVRLHPGL